MRNFSKWAGVAFIFLFLFSPGFFAAGEEEVKQVDSKDLQRTQVTPHLNAKIERGKNLLYCATFQLAWNELKDTIIGEDIVLTGDPPIAGELNRGCLTRKDISGECTVARAGFARDGILEKINQELQEKFKEEAPIVKVSFTTPDDILSYAFLYKNLTFPQEFESLKDPLPFGSGERKEWVKAFGIERYTSSGVHTNLGKQVSVLHYRNPSEFVISLKTLSQKDEVVLARLAPRGTLLETLKAVQDLVKEPCGALQRDETLRVPKIDFDLIHSYVELLNKFFKNRGFERYFICEALQNIRFKLNEKGAVLKSEARIVATVGIKRSFVFDQPFLLYLREKTSPNPYLVLWIDNAELLLKSPPAR